MTEETAKQIEGHLANIAASLKVISDSVPTRLERITESIHAATLVNCGKEPSALRSAALANELMEHLDDAASLSSDH